MVKGFYLVSLPKNDEELKEFYKKESGFDPEDYGSMITLEE